MPAGHCHTRSRVGAARKTRTGPHRATLHRATLHRATPRRTSLSSSAHRKSAEPGWLEYWNPRALRVVGIRVGRRGNRELDRSCREGWVVGDNRRGAMQPRPPRATLHAGRDVTGAQGSGRLSCSSVGTRTWKTAHRSTLGLVTIDDAHDQRVRPMCTWQRRFWRC